MQHNSNSTNIQPSSNQITQQDFTQNSMNVSSNCQKIQQHQILPYQNYDQIGMTNKKNTLYLTQKSEDPMLSQVKIERDVLLSQAVNANERNSTDSSVEIPIQIEEPVKETVAGTQKTAEKMRKDEGI